MLEETLARSEELSRHPAPTATADIEENRERIQNVADSADAIKRLVEQLDLTTGTPLDDEEKKRVSDARDAAQVTVESLLQKCAVLQKQLDLFAEWKDRDAHLKEGLADVQRQLSEIEASHAGPQDLAAIEENVRKAESVRSQITSLENEVSSAREWLSPKTDDLPEVTLSLDDVVSSLNEGKAKLAGLEDRQGHLQKTSEGILKRQREIADEINLLADKAVNAHNTYPAEQVPHEMANIRSELAPLTAKIDNLEREADDASNSVRLPESFRLPLLLDRLQELREALESHEKEATTKLALECAASKIAIVIGQANESLRLAENAYRDTKCTLDAHADALQTLDHVESLLESLSGIAELQGEGEERQALRNSAAEQSSSVAEEAAILRPMLNDRQAALRRFNDEAQTVEQELSELVTQLTSIDFTKPTDRESLHTLLSKQEELTRTVDDLLSRDQELLDQLEDVNQKREHLRRFHSNSSDALAAAQSRLKEVEKQMENEDRYKTLLATVEAEVNRLDSAGSIPDLPLSRLRDISNEWKQLESGAQDQLRSSAAPTAELSSTSEALLKRAAELSSELQIRLHNAEEQDALVRGLEAALAEFRRTLEHARTKQLTPVSIEEAVAESATLHTLLSKLAELDVHEVAEKATRSDMAGQLQELRNDAYVSFRTLCKPVEQYLFDIIKCVHFRLCPMKSIHRCELRSSFSRNGRRWLSF